MGLETIKIFISHTDDTKRECQLAKEIVNEESSLHYEKQGHKLDPFCWNDIRRGAGDPQKDLIDPHIKDPQCKLVVIILWISFGSRTPKYESGIKHEYNVVKEVKKNILIFFGNKNIRPFSINPKQLEKVQIFKKEVENERYCGHCGYFEDEEDFRKKFRGQLVKNVDKLIYVSKNIEDDFCKFSKGF